MASFLTGKAILLLTARMLVCPTSHQPFGVFCIQLPSKIDPNWWNLRGCYRALPGGLSCAGCSTRFVMPKYSSLFEDVPPFLERRELGIVGIQELKQICPAWGAQVLKSPQLPPQTSPEFPPAAEQSLAHRLLTSQGRWGWCTSPTTLSPGSPPPSAPFSG